MNGKDIIMATEVRAAYVHVPSSCVRKVTASGGGCTEEEEA